MITILTVDLQYDFFDVLSRPDAGRLAKAICLPAIRRLVAHGRRNAWQIVHIVSEHEGGQTLPPHLVRQNAQPYCMAGSDGARLIDDLTEPTDKIIRKRLYDGFSNPELATVLRASDRIVICGVATDCCVLFTAHSAANVHGKEVHIPYQAVSASTMEAYSFGLRAAAKSIASIVDVEQVIGISSQESASQLNALSMSTNLQTATEWFRSKLDCIAELQRGQDLTTMPVREILDLLEKQLAFGHSSL